MKHQTFQQDLGHRGPRLEGVRRQHWPEPALHQGATHVALEMVAPSPRVPKPTAPASAGKVLKVAIPAKAEAATRPPPTMIAAGSTPSQSLAQPANVPSVSTQ